MGLFPWDFSAWDFSAWDFSSGTFPGGSFLAWDFSAWDFSHGTFPRGSFLRGRSPEPVRHVGYILVFSPFRVSRIIVEEYY